MGVLIITKNRAIMAQTHTHFTTARQSMIDSQIHPMGVTSERLLSAFAQVPREEFVPDNMRGICYCDEDIEIAENRFLLEPSVMARMIEQAKPSKQDVALTIGSGIGYSAAILSSLVSTVIALEENQDLVAQAQKAWDNNDYVNIVGVQGALNLGWAKNAPYDLIIINGAVADIPEAIKQQLSVGGRIIAPIKPANEAVAKVTYVKRVNEDNFSDVVLFDSGTPYLQGFEPSKGFIF